MVRSLEVFLPDILTYYVIMVLGLLLAFSVMSFTRGIFGSLFLER